MVRSSAFTSFESEIMAHQSAERVSSELVIAEVGASRASIRLRGGFLTQLVLQGVPILYSPDDLAEPKLSASHAMSPVGPFDGPGGQHGVARWTDYHHFLSSNMGEIQLQAKRSDLGMGILRSIHLGDRTAWIASTLRSNSDGVERTSLGEHLYFHLPEGDPTGLKINGLTVDSYLGMTGALDEIMQGKPHFAWAFDGEKPSIAFSDGRKICLSSSVHTEDSHERAVLPTYRGMLIWHKPGTESICFEPTHGFMSSEGQMQSDLLEIPPYGSTTLTTSIYLLGV